MKLKATPQDFVVEEVAAAPRTAADAALSNARSEYAIFHLTKTSWDTFDLVDLLARRWGVPRQNIGLGGFKDRHGSTAQRISVRGLAGAPATMEDKNFRATFLGWSDRPVSAQDIRGNRFRITLRDLTELEAERVSTAAPEVARSGFPNYFDTQRFGSARHGAGFMGKEIFLGRREKALRLWFTASKHDDKKTRLLKRCVLDNWGRWERCANVSFGEYARVLACLTESHGAFHKALERIDKRYLLLALNAYQSFLFNGILTRWLASIAVRHGAALTPLRTPFGEITFYHHVPDSMAETLRSASLPVPEYDTVCDDPSISPLLSDVLQEEGIALSDLRVRQMRALHVGGVTRAATVRPEDFTVSPAEPDERYPGRQKVILSFFLTRGSYATLLVKRLLLAPAR